MKVSFLILFCEFFGAPVIASWSQDPADVSGGQAAQVSGAAWSDYPEVAPDSPEGGDGIVPIPAQKALELLQSTGVTHGALDPQIFFASSAVNVSPPKLGDGAEASLLERQVRRHGSLQRTADISTPMGRMDLSPSHEPDAMGGLGGSLAAAPGAADSSLADGDPPRLAQSVRGRKAASVSAAVGDDPTSAVVHPRIEGVQSSWSSGDEDSSQEHGSSQPDPARGEVVSGEMRQLQQENAALRQHLERWHHLGQRITERDRRLADMLARSGSAPANSTLPLLQLGSKATQGLQSSSSEQRMEEWALALPYYIAASVLVVAVPLLTASAWAARAGGGRFPEHDDPGCSTCFQPLGRRLGVVSTTVEVSELRVGRLAGLPLSESVRLHLEVDGGEAISTEVKARGQGQFIVFERVIHLQISRKLGGGSCSILLVTSLSSLVARVEVPTAKLLDAAFEQQEFFSFPLKMEGALALCRHGMEASDEPRVAMRLRVAGGKRLLGSPFAGFEP